jgi:electron transfer flavoprotein beta subunit
VKITVCVKQVGALSDEVEFNRDGRSVDQDYLDFALNEWDQTAIEAALVLREAHGGEVLAVTVGDDESDPAVRRALAMGADRGAFVRYEPGEETDPIAIAHALAGAIRGESPDLVLCGAQSADAANGAVPSALAALLGMPCVAVVVGIEAQGSTAQVRRELEGGLVEEAEVDLPAVLSVQTGMNTPRYATLRQIKQAEAEDVPELDAGEPKAARTIVGLGTPKRGEGAEMIGGNAAAVAEKIAALVAERRS